MSQYAKICDEQKKEVRQSSLLWLPFWCCWSIYKQKLFFIIIETIRKVLGKFYSSVWFFLSSFLRKRCFHILVKGLSSTFWMKKNLLFKTHTWEGKNGSHKAGLILQPNIISIFVLDFNVEREIKSFWRESSCSWKLWFKQSFKPTTSGNTKVKILHIKLLY